MDRRKEGRGREYCITFLNKTGLDLDDARNVFENFGRLSRISERNGRFFISYYEKDHADAAIARYGREYGAEYARERNDNRDRDRQAQDRNEDKGWQNQDQDRGERGRQTQDQDRGERGRQPQDRDRDRDRDFNEERHRESRPARNFGDDRSSDKGPNHPNRGFNSAQTELPFKEQEQKRNQSSFSPPVLIDSGTKIPEKFLFILGNLPPHYTQEDVILLVSETKPAHVGNITSTSNMNLIFCPIHLDSQEKVDYLQNKLDGFIIGKHRLIAMEADQLIWDSSNAY